LARAVGRETRFGACLLAKGFATQSARRLSRQSLGRRVTAVPDYEKFILMLRDLTELVGKYVEP